jgi:hypothetical protein
MGLAVVVGPLAEVLAEDAEDIECAERIRFDFAAINNALRKSGLPAHNEPETLPEFASRAPIISFPYSCLHYLRRAYAYRIQDPDSPLPEPADGEDPSEDPIIERMSTPKHHLLWHSDAEGYYVPIDFETVIEHDDLPGLMLGSSHRLFQELIYVAPTLGITLDGQTLSDVQAERIEKIIADEGHLHIELMVWILLFEAARLSIEHGTAIQFC